VAEIETDWHDPNGWYDGSVANEIGDLCNDTTEDVRLTSVLPPFPKSVQIQALWNNAANWGQGACVFARPTGYSNFYLGGDGQIWVQEDDANSASSWARPMYMNGVSFTSAPTVTSWGPYRYDLFAYDNFGNLGHIYQTPQGVIGQDNWGFPYPGTTAYTRKPEVTSVGFGRLDLFATMSCPSCWPGGTTEVVAHRSWDQGTDSGWAINLPLLPVPGGVVVASAPAAVSAGPTELDVFVRGSDNNLYRSTSTSSQQNFSSWTNWANVGSPGPVQGDPDAASWGPGRLDVFFVAAGGNGLTHYSYDHGTSFGWEFWPTPPGFPILTGTPTAIAMGDQRLKVVVPTTQGGLVTWLWDNSRFAYQNLPAGFHPVFNASAGYANSNNSVHPLSY
jgi:hypothetical protein